MTHDLTPGTLYRDDYGGEHVEYLGTAFMSELNGEDVHVFRFLDQPGCLIATRRDFGNGQTFTPLADEIDQDHQDAEG